MPTNPLQGKTTSWFKKLHELLLVVDSWKNVEEAESKSAWFQRRLRKIIMQAGREWANYVMARQAIRIEDAERRRLDLEIRIHSTHRRALGPIATLPFGAEKQLDAVNDAVNALQSRVQILETNLECSRTKESVATRRAEQAEAESARLRLQLNTQQESR